MYYDANSWTWSLADQRFYKDAEERRFRNWASGEPDSGERCALTFRNGEWGGGICEHNRYPICFDDKGEMSLLSPSGRQCRGR